jgi:hypothetical protein
MRKKKERKERSNRKFTVIRGCNTPDGEGEKRWEVGDKMKADDVSPESLKALLEMECLEEIE